MPSQNNLPILSWAEEDRPREKLVLKGKSALSDAELIAILIASGTKEMSAVDLAKIILLHVNQNLNELAGMSVNDLMKFKGIGEAKAISIVSALELGRRRKDSEQVKRPKITCSGDVYRLMKAELLDLRQEEFWIILLNRANLVIKKVQVSSGGLTGTVADPKIIFKHAIDHLACSIIITHNHPSGQLNPSEADLRLTKKLKECGQMLEIPVLDHLIFGNSGYLSMADEGLM